MCNYFYTEPLSVHCCHQLTIILVFSIFEKPTYTYVSNTRFASLLKMVLLLFNIFLMMIKTLLHELIIIIIASNLRNRKFVWEIFRFCSFRQFVVISICLCNFVCIQFIHSHGCLNFPVCRKWNWKFQFSNWFWTTFANYGHDWII